MLVQQLGASERHLGYLLLHDFVGEEVRHPVDECEPQIVCREVAGSEQLQVGVCICAGERDVLGRIEKRLCKRDRGEE